MPNFSNIHAELDNNEIHVPRDFSLAEDDTLLGKNPLGQIEWFETYWQRPVLGFYDGTQAPPLSPQAGDRYILTQLPTTGTTDMSSSGSIDTSIDTSVDTSMDTSVDTSVDTSMDTSGVLEILSEEDQIHSGWGIDAAINDIVEYYAEDNEGNIINAWQSVVPSDGYRVHNLADQRIYHFQNEKWAATLTGGVPQGIINTTYAELKGWRDDNSLIPGAWYKMTDRHIVLRAEEADRLCPRGKVSSARASRGIFYLKDKLGEDMTISQVTVNGTNILPEPISSPEGDFNAYELVFRMDDAINANTHVHGYEVRAAGPCLVILDATKTGTEADGQTVQANVIGIDYEVTDFEGGIDAEVEWHEAVYNIDLDYLSERYDPFRKNLVQMHYDLWQMVQQETDIPSPFIAFDWMNDKIGLASVINSILFIGHIVGEESIGFVKAENLSFIFIGRCETPGLGRIYANNGSSINILHNDKGIIGSIEVNNESDISIVVNTGEVERIRAWDQSDIHIKVNHESIKGVNAYAGSRIVFEIDSGSHSDIEVSNSGNESISFISPQTGLTINKLSSNYEAEFDIDIPASNITIGNTHYVGVLKITNSGSFSHIFGRDVAPRQIKVAPQPGQEITLIGADPQNSSNDSIILSQSTITLDGNNRDYIVLEQTSEAVWQEQYYRSSSTTSGVPGLTSTVINVSYAAAIDLQTNNQLVDGERYYIADDDVLLTALDTHTFAPEGWHTRELKSYAYTHVTVDSTAGSINQITTHDGWDLLSAPVLFSNDLDTDLTTLVDDINLQSVTTGYIASKEGDGFIVLPATEGLSGSVVGQELVISYAGLSVSPYSFTNGYDRFQKWFSVSYDFGSRTFYKMSDGENTVEFSLMSLSSVLQRNPIDVFPWGHDDVSGNRVTNAELTAYAVNTGFLIQNNVVEDGAKLIANGYQGSSCSNNRVTVASLLDVQVASNSITGNVVHDTAVLSVKQSSGILNGNRVQHGSHLILDQFTGGGVYFNLVEFNCTADFTGSSAPLIFNNRLSNTDVTATGHSGMVTKNDIRLGSVSLDNCSGELAENRIDNSEVTMDGFTGEGLIKNEIIFSQINLQDVTGEVTGNWLHDGSDVDLTGYSGLFRTNLIMSSIVSATNATGEIFGNEITADCTVTLNDYDPAVNMGFRRNVVSQASSFDATGASSDLADNSVKSSSSLSCINATGDVFKNEVRNSSDFVIDNSLVNFDQNDVHNGSSFILSNVSSGSVLNTKIEGGSNLLGNSFTGALTNLVIDNATSLDIQSENLTLTSPYLNVPYKTLKIDSGQNDLTISKESSNYAVLVSVDSSGDIDFDVDYRRFAGEIEVINTSTVSSISNLEFAPEVFVVKPSAGMELTFDLVSATTFVFPEDYTTVTLTGDNNDSVTFKKHNNISYAQGVYIY